MTSDWAIPQQAKLKYTQLFNLHDRSRSGFLSGLQCRDILLQSGLPRNILAEIWNLSDIDADGQLTREEFILAMHLTNQVRSGQKLPPELPSDLIPPSYRRSRSISSTSVHSAASSTSGGTTVVPGTTANDADLASQKSDTVAAPGSILNSNSFEDKRRENFEKGRAELERRRLKIIEQQSSILNEQLITCKKQVAEAKGKIDKMRSDRDTKAGLITSLEAQLQTIRDRKAFLDHEELSLIAIAKDLNLVNSAHAIELDQQATKAKQDSIRQMKEKLIELQKEKDEKATELKRVSSSLEESRVELKAVSEEVNKTYTTYKEKINQAKIKKEQFIEENRNKTIDLDSVWDAAPSFSPNPSSVIKNETTTTSSGFNEDPWISSSIPTDAATPVSSIKSSDEPIAFNTTLGTAATKNNNTIDNFEPVIDYSALSGLSPKTAFANDQDDRTTIPEAGVKLKYKALYAFEARNPDELTINPGDIITGSEVVCEPGWLSGESNGRCGLFPEAYVEPLPNDVLETTTVSNKSDNSILASQTSTTLFDHNTNVIEKVRYKVIYEFEARNPDELTMKPGDIIVGLDGPHEPGWLMGELNGQKGLFPEAYVERMAETALVEQTTEQTTVGKSRSKKAEVATVIANYRALGREQLNLEKGQLVLIRRKMDSGWWEGELQIKADETKSSHDCNRASIQRRRTELDQLVDELIRSEWDFVNDLRLCQSAYIFPISNYFDLSQIFRNWNQLIQVHESSLTRLTGVLSTDKSTSDYGVIFEAFQSLFNSIVDLYIDYCSHQNESLKQLEIKLGGDIRFRQLVNESQRRLRKLLDSQLDIKPNGDQSNASNLDPGQRSRAIQNSNLPLTSFLLKPMQRITKYELIFERMLKLIVRGGPMKMQIQVEKLKLLSQTLCQQVNEACRLKEDDEENRKKLRWCQNHIKQAVQQAGQHLDQSHEVPKQSIASDLSARLTGSFSSQVDADETSSSQQLNELIIFDGQTSYMGPRRLIKAGSLSKVKSFNRELVAFLFNDLLLLTQPKGGIVLRVDDIFKSEKAQQAYFKIYKTPILLEDLQMQSFDEDLINNVTCTSINSNMNEYKELIFSFVDRHSGHRFNLMCLSGEDKADWVREIDRRCQEVRDARAFNIERQSLYSEPRRALTTGECLGRLFVTVLDIDKTGLNSCLLKSQLHNHENLYSSWARRQSFSLSYHVPKSCIKLQLRRYLRYTNLIDNEEQREIVPLSDTFKARILNVTCKDANDSANTQAPKFDNDCTQFLVPNKPSGLDGSDCLDIELSEDSRFNGNRVLARRRINLDQLLGREPDLRETNISGRSSRQSTRSSTMTRNLQPGRPMEMIFRLKPTSTSNIANKLDSQLATPPATGLASPSSLSRVNIRLLLHFQLFIVSNGLL